MSLIPNDKKGTDLCSGCGKSKGNTRWHKIKSGLCDSCNELKKAGKKKKK